MKAAQNSHIATLNKEASHFNSTYSPIVGPSNDKKPTSDSIWLLNLLRVFFKLIGPLIPGKAAAMAFDLFTKPRQKYKTQRYNRLLDQAQGFEVTSNGNTINGYVWDNNGPSVLLAHGWETAGLHLGSFIEPLLAHGFRVVTFDGPAHGNSEGHNATLLDFTEAMRVINEEIGPMQHIIGHSFGGLSSVFLAAYYSNEIHLDHMVLISVPNKLTGVLEEFARTLQLPQRVVISMDHHIKSIYKMDPLDIETGKMGAQMNVKNVLVVHDRYDQILPFANGLEIVHDLSNAVLLETQNLGHNRLLKHPAVISNIVEFLKS